MPENLVATQVPYSTNSLTDRRSSNTFSGLTDFGSRASVFSQNPMQNLAIPSKNYGYRVSIQEEPDSSENFAQSSYAANS